MSITKYRAFIHVLEQGSITGAAKTMGYSQPGISKMMDSLEAELNISLFRRNGSSIEPTDNGKAVYAYCREIVKAEDALFDAVNAMNGLITGTIHIGALNSIILDYVPKVIKTYSNTYPIIQIHLDELSYAEIIDQLKINAIDIGFTSEFRVRGLEFVPLFRDPIRLIVNKEHPFAAYGALPISSLNGCNFITLPPGGDDLLIAVRKTEKFTPIANYYVHSDAAAISMVSADLGVYIISEMQCRHLPDNVVKLRFQEDVYRTMGIGVNSHKSISPAVKEMLRISKLHAEHFSRAK